MNARALLSTPIVLVVLARLAPCGETPEAAQIREALCKGLSLVAASAAAYESQRECFSCHHQALPVMAIALAGAQGLRDAAWDSASRGAADFTLHYYAGRRAQMIEGKGVPGNSYSAGYALASLADAGRAADETTDGLVAFLLQRQEDNGRWRITSHRPPLEDSDFTATALAVRGLKAYGRDAQADAAGHGVEKARRWLLDSPAKTNEDLTFRLLGLAWAAADATAVAEAAEELWRAQRDDGGWAQAAGLDSDAYATGQSLAALRMAGGARPGAAAWRRGLAWLLARQQPDGSWKVESRARPFQTYFESGFPHGKAQFISISASCWAVMALALAQ